MRAFYSHETEAYELRTLALEAQTGLTIANVNGYIPTGIFEAARDVLDTAHIVTVSPFWGRTALHPLMVTGGPKNLITRAHPRHAQHGTTMHPNRVVSALPADFDLGAVAEASPPREKAIGFPQTSAYESASLIVLPPDSEKERRSVQVARLVRGVVTAAQQTGGLPSPKEASYRAERVSQISQANHVAWAILAMEEDSRAARVAKIPTRPYLNPGRGVPPLSRTEFEVEVVGMEAIDRAFGYTGGTPAEGLIRVYEQHQPSTQGQTSPV